MADARFGLKRTDGTILQLPSVCAISEQTPLNHAKKTVQLQQTDGTVVFYYVKATKQHQLTKDKRAELTQAALAFWEAHVVKNKPVDAPDTETPKKKTGRKTRGSKQVRAALPTVPLPGETE